jgi:IS30 family transposase
MRSPGRPPVARREDRQRFWAAIANGLSSGQAGVAAGVSPAVGVRWFREGGGMPSVTRAPLSGRYLSFVEREEIAILNAGDCGVREIARRVGRSASTISRELRRNAATRGGALEYRATTAQWHADRRARRPKTAKLAASPRLRRYVQDRLAGVIATPEGTSVAGPEVRWIGRRHGRRRDRRWAGSWSPQQIANRLPVDFPDDDSMRISHEAIYQALYVQGRGALRRELTACLRTGRALRVPRARTRGRSKQFVSPEIMISERPAEAADRAVPGHWEGDLILGLGSSAIGTLVERATRFTMLLHLPRMDGHGQPRVHNGPALAGHGAQAVRDAIASSITTLPEQLRRSLTWDQGAEMAQHAQLRIDTGLAIYFCDPHSPWQRGTNENTNGLLRQYFPRGTDLSKHTPNELDAVAAALNGRPRRPSAGSHQPKPSTNTSSRSAPQRPAERRAGTSRSRPASSSRWRPGPPRPPKHQRRHAHRDVPGWHSTLECSRRWCSRTELSRRAVPASPLRGSRTHTIRSSTTTRPPNTYPCSSKAVLQGPLEPGQYTALVLGQRCREARHRRLHGRPRIGARQRRLRELLRVTEEGADPPALVADAPRRAERGLRLDRGLVQPPPAALHARLPLTRPVRGQNSERTRCEPRRFAARTHPS